MKSAWWKVIGAIFAPLVLLGTLLHSVVGDGGMAPTLWTIVLVFCMGAVHRRSVEIAGEDGHPGLATPYAKPCLVAAMATVAAGHLAHQGTFPAYPAWSVLFGLVAGWVCGERWAAIRRVRDVGPAAHHVRPDDGIVASAVGGLAIGLLLAGGTDLWVGANIGLAIAGVLTAATVARRAAVITADTLAWSESNAEGVALLLGVPVTDVNDIVWDATEDGGLRTGPLTAKVAAKLPGLGERVADFAPHLTVVEASLGGGIILRPMDVDEAQTAASRAASGGVFVDRVPSALDLSEFDSVFDPSGEQDQ